MSGSWEKTEQNILVITLTREIVATKWAIGFKNLIIPEGCTARFYSGMPFDHGRNTGCKAAIEENFKYILFLDDDIIPPLNLLLELPKHNKDIVSGLYFRRSLPLLPVMYNETDKKSTPVAPVDKLMEVDLVGAGCLLINTQLLKKMEKNWFEWLVDREDLPPLDRTSEDFTFCRKAKQLGSKIYVDTTMRCEHVGLGSSINGEFIPLGL